MAATGSPPLRGAFPYDAAMPNARLVREAAITGAAGIGDGDGAGIGDGRQRHRELNSFTVECPSPVPQPLFCRKEKKEMAQD